jgi:hypothetical protein
MDNLNQATDESSQQSLKKTSWPLIVFLIIVLIAIVFAWQFTGNKNSPTPIIVEQPEPKPIPVIEPEIEKDNISPESVVEKPEIDIIEEEVVLIESSLPSLNKSDDWIKIKLPEITWRKELLALIVDNDMIRRFVVFTDNFAQGSVVYEHSPFILPAVKFAVQTVGDNGQTIVQSTGTAQGQKNVLQWDENTSKRFSVYVDLLRSMDSESLVQWYLEAKPLINEAYSELGYEDDFTNTLQDAITRVLDMELPKSSMDLIQPSVMYKFANPELEALPDSDKLLLRLGKDNLLVIKSVLLEIHEKIAQQKNGVN